MKNTNLTTNILAILLVLSLVGCFILWRRVDSITEKVITTPKIQGKGVVLYRDSITTIPVPIILKGESEAVIVQVDEGYKKLYDEALDSLERQKLYYEAVTVRQYNDTIVDNDEITITTEAQTTGRLNYLLADYEIKERRIEFETETIYNYPRLSLYGQVEAMMSLKPVAKFEIGGFNKNGLGFSASYDTNKNVWIGVSQSLRIKN